MKLDRICRVFMSSCPKQQNILLNSQQFPSAVFIYCWPQVVRYLWSSRWRGLRLGRRFASAVSLGRAVRRPAAGDRPGHAGLAAPPHRRQPDALLLLPQVPWRGFLIRVTFRPWEWTHWSTVRTQIFHRCWTKNSMWTTIVLWFYVKICSQIVLCNGSWGKEPYSGLKG